MLAAASIDVFPVVAGLLGGLALFLFGMDRLTDALRAAAGGGLKRLLTGLTRNRFVAAFTGALVTALIQSSSVTTVLVVGFASAGLMTLTQSVGVILGANVGSTVTAQIIAFNATELTMPMLALGFGVGFLGKQEKLRAAGMMVFGLGLVFLGMSVMGEATAPLRSYDPFTGFMRSLSRPEWSILAGMLFTALVQSSAATTGIVMAFAAQGFITLESGIALTMGANIGTCVTAWLATLGKPVIARRAAYVHVLFNVAGVGIWIFFLPELAWLVVQVSGDSELTGTAKLAAEAPRQIANAHTIFNLANTLLFLPFAGVLGWVATRLAPGQARERTRRSQPKYLQAIYLDTPALALDQVRRELGRFGRHLDRLLARDLLDVSSAGTGSERRELKDEARDLRLLYGAILDYLRVVGSGEMTGRMTREHERMLRVATHLQNVVDSVVTQLEDAQQLVASGGYEPLPAVHAALGELQQSVRDELRDAVRAFDRRDDELADRVESHKSEIRRQCDAVLERVTARLRSGSAESLDAFRHESEAVEMLYRIYYFAKRIAKNTSADESESIPETR